jgi:hypothetical protein
MESMRPALLALPSLFGWCRTSYGSAIAAQVLNAFLLPLVILVALAVKALPKPMRPRGLYLWILIGVSASVITLGLYGGVSGLL